MRPVFIITRKEGYLANGGSHMKYLMLLTALLFSVAIVPRAYATEQAANDETQSKQKFSCSDMPRYCKHMDSCEQAEFALEHCGMSKLDRDRDGIPCENVCG